MYIVGIDEAGRGPAVGPMVYAIAGVKVTDQKCLKRYGVNDSKQLTDEQRRQIFMQMKEEKLVYYDTESISARQISEKMNGITKISLN